MNRARFAVLVAFSVTACRSTELPDPPPPPSKGTIQGTLVFSQAGQSVLVAAVGASIEILGTSITATSTETGYFSLSPVPVTSGAVLVRFDADGDGAVDHQKLLRIEALQGGPGKDVALGQVTLGGNALVKGAVLRADQLTSSTGHGGTSIFVPEGPFLVNSGDNGAFTFENLPEGDLTLSFFRPGYVTQQAKVSLRAGEVFTLATIVLTAETTATTKTKVTGLVTLFGAQSSDGVTVRAGTNAMTTTDTTGNYTFTQLDPGVYVFGFEKAGYGTISLRNVVVNGATSQVAQVIMVPGTSTPANLDAGTGGGTGSTATGDGGLAGDGGMSGPRAIIDPPPAFVVTSGSFTLNGSNSVGERPLIYQWTQTAGPMVTIANNGTVLAANPMIAAPPTATILKFTLRITDATGLTTTESAEALVPVGAPPKALIAPGFATTAFASQQIEFDGSPSSDPSGIIQYNWSVLPSDAGITVTPSGKFVRLTMPATVPTALSMTVKLDVVNGLLISSTMPATATFTLTTASAPTWSVDAGFPKAVAGDSTVTLNGGASAPGFSGATFTYLWSPSQEPSTGAADWQLGDATSPITTFIAPHVMGAPRLINFTLTATSTSGLMPAMQSAVTWVSVVDRAPPNVISTSIIGGRGSAQGMIIDFDEPIDPASAINVQVTAATGSPFLAPSIAERIVQGTRLTLLYGGTGAPLTSSNVLSVSNIRDLAPGSPNTSGSIQYPFIAQARWSTVYESTSSSSEEPRPGIAVLTDGGVVTSVLVFGRKNGQAWFAAPVDLSCSTTPCALSDDVTAPAASLTNTPVRGPRGVTSESTAFALAQVRDQQGDAGIGFMNTGSGWAAMASPPGTMFFDGTQLNSVFAENNLLQIARFDLPSKTWSLADAGLITNDVQFATGPLADPLPIGVGSATNATIVVGRTSTSGEIRAYLNPRNTQTWGAFGSLGSNAADPVIEARTAISSNYSKSGYTSFLSVSGRLRVVVFGEVNNATDLWASGVTSFDVGYHANGMWVVASVNGLLRIKIIPYGTFTPVAFSGPAPLGEIMNDPACIAESPELTFFNEKVFISWAEKCVAQPWKMYFRYLQ